MSQQIHKELKAYEDKRQTEALATQKEAEASKQKLIEEETKRAGWTNKYFGAKLGLSFIVCFLLVLFSAAVILFCYKNVDAGSTSTLLGTFIVLCGAISWMCEHHRWKSPEKKKLFEEVVPEVLRKSGLARCRVGFSRLSAWCHRVGTCPGSGAWTIGWR